MRPKPLFCSGLAEDLVFTPSLQEATEELMKGRSSDGRKENKFYRHKIAEGLNRKDKTEKFLQHEKTGGNPG